VGAIRIALVIGGNKGIGLETCRQLMASKGLRVVLVAKNEARGLEAVKRIRCASGDAEVYFHQLDVIDPSSAARLAEFVRDLDILVRQPFLMRFLVNLGTWKSDTVPLRFKG
jgi:(+)-neomenthol dehydrogenase